MSMVPEANLQRERVSALANIAAYTGSGATDYVEGAPHVKHACLRDFYAEQLLKVYSTQAHVDVPAVLDLGAGEGSVTLGMLELGASVTAVDISEEQLSILRERCAKYADRLQVHVEDIGAFLQRAEGRYNIVTANSFLHHIPDYLGLLRQVVPLIASNGVFFSFQDPLRYSSLRRSTKLFSDFAYFCWRARQRDFVGGLWRYVRRRRGVYLESCDFDNAEYHVVRDGVDQDRIHALFQENGFDCTVHSYFSTQSALFQKIGSSLGAANTFSIVAQRKASAPSPKEADSRLN